MSLSTTAKPIPYHKAYRVIAGSVTATILMQQLEYWFATMKGDSFYKYLQPPKSSGSSYREGDSWTEEMGFSTDEFRSAFARVGIAYKSKSEFDAEPDPFGGRMYCSYYDKINHQTWYLRNHQVVEDNLAKVEKPMSGYGQSQSPDIGNPNIGRLEIPMSNIYTENTTENTHIDENIKNKGKNENTLPKVLPEHTQLIEHVAAIQGLSFKANFSHQVRAASAILKSGISLHEAKAAAEVMRNDEYWRKLTFDLNTFQRHIHKYLPKEEIPEPVPEPTEYELWVDEQMAEARRKDEIRQALKNGLVAK